MPLDFGSLLSLICSYGNAPAAIGRMKSSRRKLKTRKKNQSCSLRSFCSMRLKREGGHPTLTPQQGLILPRFPGQPVLSASTDNRFRIGYLAALTDLLCVSTPSAASHPLPDLPLCLPLMTAKSGQNNSAPIVQNS